MILLFCLQVRQELADVQAKRALMEAVMGETKQLQELSEYPEIYVQSYLFLTFYAFLFTFPHAFGEAFFNLEHAHS